MNTDKPDFLAVIAEADPCGEGGAWLLSVGSGWLVASSMGKRDKSAMPYCPSRFAVNYGLEDGNIEGPQLRRFLQHQLGLTGVTRVSRRCECGGTIVGTTRVEEKCYSPQRP